MDTSIPSSIKGRELSPAKIEEMFRAWCERPSARHVADKCKVSRVAATKYIKLKADEWCRRRNEIDRMTQEKADMNYVDIRADNLKILVASFHALVTPWTVNRDGRNVLEIPPNQLTVSNMTRIVGLIERMIGGSIERKEKLDLERSNGTLEGDEIERLLEEAKKVEEEHQRESINKMFSKVRRKLTEKGKEHPEIADILKSISKEMTGDDDPADKVDPFRVPYGNSGAEIATPPYVSESGFSLDLPDPNA